MTLWHRDWGIWPAATVTEWTAPSLRELERRSAVDISISIGKWRWELTRRPGPFCHHGGVTVLPVRVFRVDSFKFKLP